MVPENQHIVNKIKLKVQQYDPTAEVILFGSRARGDHRAESDWDVLIVTDHEVNRAYKNKIQDILYELQLEYEISIDSLFRNKMDWKLPTSIPVYNEIKKEGVPI